MIEAFALRRFRAAGRLLVSTAVGVLALMTAVLAALGRPARRTGTAPLHRSHARRPAPAAVRQMTGQEMFALDISRRSST